MRSLLPKILLISSLLICGNAFADREVYSQWTSTFDKVTDDSFCTNGQIMEKSGGVWVCGSDDSSAGGGSVRVSEDGTAVVSADTINFTTGLKATTSASGKATVSGDMSTTTTPGIASFDTSNFTVGSFGGVSVKTNGIDLADEATGILKGSSFPALSGDVSTTAGSLITSIEVNSVALTTDTTGNYAAGDAEAGNALTGDSATAFFSAGQIEVARGGTALGSVSNDAVLVGNNAGTAYDQPALPNCIDSGGQHLNYTAATGVFACGTSGDGGAGTPVFPRISEDGTAVASADTVNYTTGLKASVVTGTKVQVSGDMATTTTPGIASFDSTDFSVGPFGGVTLADTPSATPSVNYYDSDATDGDINVQELVNCTDAGSGTEDCDWTLKQQIAGTLTTALTFDADGIVTSARDVAVPDEVYGAGWNASLEVPTKNALYDKIETLGAASSGTINVSEDGVAVVSADTINFTTGLKATTTGAKVVVSGDMATTTSPGIASFDTTYFTIGSSFGGVSLKTVPVNTGGTGLTSVSNDAVLVGNNAGTGYDQPALPSCSNATTSKLLYDNSTNVFTCGSDQNSGGATAWNDLGDATADGSVAFAGTTQTITGNTNDITAIGQDMLHLTYTNDAATDALSQKGIVIENAASTNGMEAFIYLTNSDTDDVVTSGIIMDSGAGLITTALDVSDAEIGTALSFGANDIVGTTGLINLTNFDVGADGDLDRIKNIAYSWPADDGDSGEQLQTDGSGNLTWESAGGGATKYTGIFMPPQAKLPLVNPAQIDAGTPGWRLLFDTTTGERVSYDTVISPYQGGAVSAEIAFTATATTGGVSMAVFVECITSSDSTIIDAGSYDAANWIPGVVPGTAGHMGVIGRPLTNFDSCANKDRMRIMVSRDTVSADDTATGDIALRHILLYEV